MAGDCPVRQELGRVVAGGDSQPATGEWSKRSSSICSEATVVIVLVAAVVQEDVGGLVESQLVARDAGVAWRSRGASGGQEGHQIDNIDRHARGDHWPD